MPRKPQIVIVSSVVCSRVAARVALRRLKKFMVDDVGFPEESDVPRSGIRGCTVNAKENK